VLVLLTVAAVACAVVWHLKPSALQPFINAIDAANAEEANLGAAERVVGDWMCDLGDGPQHAFKYHFYADGTGFQYSTSPELNLPTGSALRFGSKGDYVVIVETSTYLAALGWLPPTENKTTRERVLHMASSKLELEKKRGHICTEYKDGWAKGFHRAIPSRNFGEKDVITKAGAIPLGEAP
jgi:hypothetical protein